MSTNAEASGDRWSRLCKVQQALPSRRVTRTRGLPAHSRRLARAGAPWAEAGGRSGVPADLCASRPSRPRPSAPSAHVLPVRPPSSAHSSRKPSPDHQAQGPCHSSAFSGQWSYPGKAGSQEGGVPTASRPPVLGQAPEPARRGAPAQGPLGGEARSGRLHLAAHLPGGKSAGPLTPGTYHPEEVPARQHTARWVDSTLKMRQTRTMRKLGGQERTQSVPCQAARPARSDTAQEGAGQGARPPPRGLGTSALGPEGSQCHQPRPPGARQLQAQPTAGSHHPARMGWALDPG